eukprot:11192537-Lingulodinium_polyedra.AAC.1
MARLMRQWRRALVMPATRIGGRQPGLRPRGMTVSVLKLKTHASAEGIDIAVTHWKECMGSGDADALVGVVVGWA